MMIYFIILGILGIGSLVDVLILNEKIKKMLYIFFILMLIAFFGTRVILVMTGIHINLILRKQMIFYKFFLEIIKAYFIQGMSLDFNYIQV
ncbi:MAG: hypothetical protein OGM09_07945 [Fusobacterium varium]|uniref:hypothetical protein n=1 Tax=Fusobacterium varium TaxID=856 RepID=UPI00242BDB39|nr:hypothetical protein [Fusobacterium varium]UYI80135.1 MAG: hypothetical protein OGM09_07945 [Fusobacterium varium]